jgi:hypothetical protein
MLRGGREGRPEPRGLAVFDPGAPSRRGCWEVRGFTSAALDRLESAVTEGIVRLAEKDLPGDSTPFHNVAAWAGAIERTTAVEVFTTNYDLPRAPGGRASGSADQRRRKGRKRQKSPRTLGQGHSRERPQGHENRIPTGQATEARKGTRTPDPLLTMEVLYQLSYPGSRRDSSWLFGRHIASCSLLY